MRKTQLKQLVREMYYEGDTLREMTLPPGFTQSTVSDIPTPENQELDEADLGANTTDVSDADLDAYIARRAGKQSLYKSGQPKLTKKGKPIFVPQNLPTDKYNYPFLHRSNIVDDSGKPINSEELKKKIMVRPDRILKQTAKLGKSGGMNYAFYNIGLPALKGLIVDEVTGKFKIIDTCPGAGACKVFCYARKGGYVQWKASSLSQSRILNFLINDWQGFKNKLVSELKSEQIKYSEKNTKLVVRWHDSGDFFSPDYLKIAFDIANELPDVLFYAYTKMAGVSLANKPKNFITNFSQGAKQEQEKQIDTTTQKHSVVVPRQMFEDLTRKEGDGADKKLVWNSPKDLETFKRKLSMKYSIDEKSIITYEELMNKPEDPTEIGKYNVIVVPGDGDDAASRKDVLGTYLLQH